MEIESIRHAIVSMENTDHDFFYLFGYLTSPSSFVVQKHIFRSIGNFETTPTAEADKKILSNEAIGNIGKSISCFKNSEILGTQPVMFGTKRCLLYDICGRFS